MKIILNPYNLSEAVVTASWNRSIEIRLKKISTISKKDIIGRIRLYHVKGFKWCDLIALTDNRERLKVKYFTKHKPWRRDIIRPIPKRKIRLTRPFRPDDKPF